jgi:hypothetical protein
MATKAQKEAAKVAEAKKAAAARNAANAKKQSPGTGSEKAPSGGGSWFARGAEGMTKKHQIDKMNEMKREKGVPRFFLKSTAGESGKDNQARIVFLNTTGFFIFEHNLKLDNRWGNHFTCTKDFQPCPICQHSGDKPVFVCYYWVIDTRKFTRKDGTESVHRRVLYPAKGAATQIIEDLKKENGGSLRGLVVDVKRMSDKDPNCGRDFKVIGRLDPVKKFGVEKVLSEKAFDELFMKVLAPPTPEELIAAGVNAQIPVGSAEDMGDLGTTDAALSEDDMKDLID